MRVDPFPTHIQIQTTTGCGADCSICPHPVKSPSWINGMMTDALFERIAGQLKGRRIDYLCPYLMADGLSDKKIFDRIERLREALPQTHIELSTTGMYLAPRLADRLIEAPLTELRISSHGITAEQYARTMPGVNFDRAMENILRFIERWRQCKPFALSVVTLWGLWPREEEEKIKAFWAAHDVPLSKWRVVSRADQVDLTVFGESPADPTPFATRGQPPFRCRFNRDTQWMHILSDGRVTLCCMDYEQRVILGDASRQSLENIWNSSAYAAARDRVRGDGVGESFICDQGEWRGSESKLKIVDDGKGDQPRNPDQVKQPAAV